MKKIFYLVLAVGAVSMIASCNKSANKEAAADSDSAVVEVVEEVATDSVADRFRNAEYQSDVATDSTYARTASGLKYMIEKEGTGVKPGPTDQVTVHYTGRLLDGSVFDSSVQRGEPATFPLNGVIAGWTEGLQLMKEGSKYVFYIPSDLAYGAAGAGRDIPPYADLIFEVELIKVN